MRATLMDMILGASIAAAAWIVFLAMFVMGGP